MRHALLVGLALVVAGCALVPAPNPAPATRPCAEVFSAERCEAILVAAAERVGVAEAAVIGIGIQPDPTPRTDGILETRSGGPLLRIVVTTADGTRQVTMCAGIPSSPACMADPALEVGSSTSGGYRDLPCAGEAPDGCAQPLPVIDPAAAAAAQPLVVDRLSVPVPGLGAQEIVLGAASLPNGILTEASASLVDPWPDGVHVSEDGIRLHIRSTDPARPPFLNYYEHGWWPGTERVEAVLVFEVTWHAPGATLELRDLVVR